MIKLFIRKDGRLTVAALMWLSFALTMIGGSFSLASTAPKFEPEKWELQVLIRDLSTKKIADVLQYTGDPNEARPTFKSEKECETFIKTDMDFRHTLLEAQLDAIQDGNLMDAVCSLEID